MRLALLHARAGTMELLRLPAFAVPTVGFPSLFFLFFAVPGLAAQEPELATALYAGFAVLGVAFFQFGVGIAVERVSPWEQYLRTLPLAARTRFAGRVLSALAFGAASSAVVVCVAVLTVSPQLSALAWLELAGALLAGSTPFALLGIALGYLASPKGALPIANVVYLALSYAGGLWTGPEGLPGAVQGISEWLPTRAYADLLAGAALGVHVSGRVLLVLALWGVGAGVLAGWAYRRDEGQRFR
jgi:ABC-2 type transport system permease protein